MQLTPRRSPRIASINGGALQATPANRKKQKYIAPSGLASVTVYILIR